MSTRKLLSYDFVDCQQRCITAALRKCRFLPEFNISFPYFYLSWLTTYGSRAASAQSCKPLVVTLFTKASIHDIHYLNDINGTKISTCKLIGGKAYRSMEYQLNLFDTARIELITPMRTNQKNYQPFDYVLKKSRKRIETFFSQLCDQFMLKRNMLDPIEGYVLE